MHIRLAKQEEVGQIRALWQYCFFDEEPYLDWVFGERFCAENTVVAERENLICGALQLVPYTIRIRQIQQPCYYIAGVSVLPQERGRGTAASLMAFAEQVAEQRRISLFLLVPALDGYYERFGFVPVASKMEFEFPVELVKSYRFHGKTYRAEEIETLLAVDRAYNKFWDVYIDRTRQDMEQLLHCFTNTGHGGAYLFYQDGRAVAYMMYQLTPQEIQVPACAYLSKEGANAILQFIGNHVMQTKRAQLRLACGDPIFTKLYQTGVRRILTPSFMAKRINSTPEETFVYLGGGTGDSMALLDRKCEHKNQIYLNLPEWY